MLTNQSEIAFVCCFSFLFFLFVSRVLRTSGICDIINYFVKQLNFCTLDYAVVEKPTLETWMQGGLDYIVLKNLSIDGIRTIGSVLGQSIALDYYIRQVRHTTLTFVI